MTHLILVRHSISQPEPGVSPHQWALTDEGRARCAALAQQLLPYRVACIASSDEQKAVATARLLAAHLQLTSPLTIEPDFGETRRSTAPYFDNPDAFRAAIQAAMNDPGQVVFGEEAFADARTRFVSALQRLMEAHFGETIAVVTHGTIMSLMLGHFAGVDTFETWQALQMPAYALLTPNLDLLDLKYSI